MTGEPRRLQDIQRTERIVVEVQPRIRNRCRHRHLAGKVVYDFRIPDGDLHGSEIPHVRLDDAQPMILRMALEPREIMSGPRPHQCIEHRDVLSGREQVADQVRADEAGTTYDERADTHAVLLIVLRAFPFSLFPYTKVLPTLPPEVRYVNLSGKTLDCARGSHKLSF